MAPTWRLDQGGARTGPGPKQGLEEDKTLVSHRQTDSLIPASSAQSPPFQISRQGNNIIIIINNIIIIIVIVISK